MGYTIDPFTKLANAQQNILNIISSLGQANPKQIKEALPPPFRARDAAKAPPKSPRQGNDSEIWTRA